MFLAFANVVVDTVQEVLWYLLAFDRPTTSVETTALIPHGPSQSAHVSPGRPKPNNEPGAIPETGHNPPEPVAIADKPPAFFALIIGINDYPMVDKLRGAVPDAEAVKGYLESQLHVPNGHIRTLYNASATRAQILKGIQDLAKDHRIRKGDPILIFYAGHGGTTDTPIGWNAGAPKIQTLIPYDYCCQIDGHTVLPIPDRTIGALLHHLADVKGDNITVIFDCCHSGSGTRKDGDTTLCRGIKDILPVPPRLDEEIWSNIDRATTVAALSAHAGLRSHVLLAACGANELASESNGRGVFTTALFDILTAVGPNNLTYADLIKRLPDLSTQNPQCEGFHQQRILFNARAPSNGRVLYRLRKKHGQWILQAGAAHGVSPEAQFEVYKDTAWPPTHDKPLGTLVARSVDPFSTDVDVLSGSSVLEPLKVAYALQSRAGAEEDLRLHVALDEGLIDLFRVLAEEMSSRRAGQGTFSFVDHAQAELSVTLSNDLAVFNIPGSRAAAYGLTRLPFSVNPHQDDLRPVIRAASHFFWHLRRTAKKGLLRSHLQLEFTELRENPNDLDVFLMPTKEPTGQNLIRNNVVDIVVDKDKEYGLKVLNMSQVPLYVSAFYFDHSNLSISSYYQPPTAGGRVDPPLPPCGPHSSSELPIGYGASGVPPFKYWLRADQDLDVGFLKLFISTTAVDFSSIPQASPFDERRATSTPERSYPLIWDTETIAIIQRR